MLLQLHQPRARLKAARSRLAFACIVETLIKAFSNDDFESAFFVFRRDGSGETGDDSCLRC